MQDLRYETLMGKGPEKIIHWEHWSNPDAISYITGIDFYEHPKKSSMKLNDLYPFVYLPVPNHDNPMLPPEKQKDKGKGRWGHTYRDHWQQQEAGYKFESVEQMLKFSPLENADFSSWTIPEAADYRDEETIYQSFRKRYPDWWEEGKTGAWEKGVGFYNTLFMWPILIFGYEKFLSICLEPKFERIMDEFAEISHRVFKAISRIPANWICCHDDIVTTAGPLCSPSWIRKYIFPRYEEYWGILKDTGKQVVFMSDGCVDIFADDIMKLGVRGIISEPYTDYKSIAKKYENCFIAGEGDVRVLMRNNPEEIRKMVETMTETGNMSRGYMMCIGNHIPFNVPPSAVKLYLDLSAEIAYRKV